MTYGKGLVETIRDQQHAIRGMMYDAIFHDEAHHLDAAAYQHVYNSMMTTSVGSIKQSPAPEPKRREPVSPLSIVCNSCGAAAGERCNRGSDPRTGRIRVRGYHFRRKDDARLVTAAAQAFGV